MVLGIKLDNILIVGRCEVYEVDGFKLDLHVIEHDMAFALYLKFYLLHNFDYERILAFSIANPCNIVIQS